MELGHVALRGSCRWAVYEPVKYTCQVDCLLVTDIKLAYAVGMIYLSNISPLWPMARQEKQIAGVDPGGRRFVDILTAADRQAHLTDRLLQRAAMLRPTKRQGGDIVVASLAVLDWTAAGLMEVLALAMARGMSVRVLDAAIVILPGGGPEILHAAAIAFATSRKRDAEIVRGMAGGAISAARRMDAARAKAETIRAEWAMPSAEYPTLALLERAGISRNTAKLYLGPRADAQRKRAAETKRRLKREQRNPT